MARPRKHLPPGSRELIEAMIKSEKPITETAVAKNLGMALQTWRRIRRDNDAAQELWEEACAAQRDRLITTMYHRAIDEGDVNAGQFLLRALHEVSERGDREDAERVGVVIQLPGSMGHDEYLKVIGKEPKLIEGGDA